MQEKPTNTSYKLSGEIQTIAQKRNQFFLRKTETIVIMRFNYAVILASISGASAQTYDQGLLSQCPCLLTATCVPNTPCYNSQRVRKVRRSPTLRGGCAACNGQGPCSTCQQAPQKQYEAVPVFIGEPQVYETVGARRSVPSYSSYTSVQQPIPQYTVQQAPQYTVQQAPLQYAVQQAPQVTVQQAPQYIVQQPVQQLPIIQPTTPQVATISQQYVYPQAQPACNNCASPPIQRERVYVPLKPGFFQRMRMNRAVKQTARQSCSGPSCGGCATCGGSFPPTVQQPSYQVLQQQPAYQILSQEPVYSVGQQPAYQLQAPMPVDSSTLDPGNVEPTLSSLVASANDAVVSPNLDTTNNLVAAIDDAATTINPT